MSTIYIRGRCHKTILTGPKITGIIHLLEITKESVRYSEFHKKSKISLKRSFITYLKFCVEKGLIINHKITKKENPRKAYQSWFTISDKGRMFLEMLK